MPIASLHISSVFKSLGIKKRPEDMRDKHVPSNSLR